jgi:hypothetical protein
VALCTPGKRKSRVDVFKGNDVSPAAINKPLNGIEGVKDPFFQTVIRRMFPPIFCC